MELVSASKMRKAQENALMGRDYARMSKELLTRLRELTDVRKHPLFELRAQPKARLHILITSDRGLAGAYNSSVLKAFARAIQADRDSGTASYAITIGRQGSTFAGKLEHVQILGAYTNFPEHPTANDLAPILRTAIDCFLKDAQAKSVSEEDEETTNVQELELPAVDYVDIIYTDYKSSILQEVNTTRLLPAAFTDVEIEPDLERADFEPTPQAVLDNVAERLIEAELYQTILESLASEQSARMMAMKNASDNASDIIEDLTLAFNTARQAAITQELAEITGGAEAIK